MTVNHEDVHNLSRLVESRNSLIRQIARYTGHGVNVYEIDRDHGHPHSCIPSELGIEILGAALGIVTARLVAKGVHIPEIAERECYECDGTGTKPQRRNDE